MKKKIASMMLACLMVICLLPLQAGSSTLEYSVPRKLSVASVRPYARAVCPVACAHRP